MKFDLNQALGSLEKICLDYYVAAQIERLLMKGQNQLDLWYLSLTIVSLGYTYLASIMILALRVIENKKILRVFLCNCIRKIEQTW